MHSLMPAWYRSIHPLVPQRKISSAAQDSDRHQQVVSRTHILAACFRALNDYMSGRLKSRNVHSEIVFALSPNNNVCIGFLYINGVLIYFSSSYLSHLQEMAFELTRVIFN